MLFAFDHFDMADRFPSKSVDFHRLNKDRLKDPSTSRRCRSNTIDLEVRSKHTPAKRGEIPSSPSRCFSAPPSHGFKSFSPAPLRGYSVHTMQHRTRRRALSRCRDAAMLSFPIFETATTKRDSVVLVRRGDSAFNDGQFWQGPLFVFWA